MNLAKFSDTAPLMSLPTTARENWSMTSETLIWGHFQELRNICKSQTKKTNNFGGNGQPNLRFVCLQFENLVPPAYF